MTHNKKGSFLDIIFIFVFILVFALVIMFWGKIKIGINDSYQDTSANTLPKQIMQESSDRYYNMYDGIFFVVVVLLILTFFILCYSVNTHPALFFVFFIILTFILIIGGILGNVYDKVENTSSMASEASSYQFMDTIMDNIVMVILVVGFIGLILLFSRFR